MTSFTLKQQRVKVVAVHTPITSTPVAQRMFAHPEARQRVVPEDGTLSVFDLRDGRACADWPDRGSFAPGGMRMS